MSDEGNLESLQAEAAAETDKFEFGGRFFVPVAKMDLRVLMALQRNDFDRAMALMLGKEQADEIYALDTEDVIDEAAITRLANVWAKTTGATSLGESKASTDS